MVPLAFSETDNVLAFLLMFSVTAGKARNLLTESQS